MDWNWLDWAAAAALGGLVGASELISRYKDDPVAALKAWSGILYVAINSAASMGALGLIRANGWFGSSRWEQVLMAGKGMMPSFAYQMTKEQLAALLAYLHTGMRDERSP